MRDRSVSTIGLIGDRDDRVTAHRAVPEALRLAAEAEGVRVDVVWIPTDEIDAGTSFGSFAALWAVPKTPYRNADGALHAIRVARERRLPFLGTCGGFQHVIVEVARNGLGWTDADHAETNPDAARAVIRPLECSLIDASQEIRFLPDTRMARAYGTDRAVEGYHCRYGVNPDFRRALTEGLLRENAVDAAGDLRGVELDDHPFFVATLFQPERAALAGRVPPLVRALVHAAVGSTS